MRLFGKVIDERFWAHRRRSTGIAGVASCVVAVGLFEYRYFVDGILSWDLLAVALTFVAVKVAIVAWYLLTH